MKIKFLGTAAYEGVPALFCTCDVCKHAREAGGHSLRSRCQALVDDELLLDFGPDTVWHGMRYGLDWNRITHCLITHSHSDHFYPEDMDMSAPGYSRVGTCMHYYGAKAAYENMSARFAAGKMEGRAQAHLVEPGVKFTVGDYTVLPLWADHDPTSTPVFYSIEKAGKRLLYAHDTGIFPEQSWELLAKEGRYDLVSLDCTGGDDLRRWEHGHMCVTTNGEVAERMRGLGLVDEHTKLIINHFSHNGRMEPEQLAAAAERHGFLVSYDGMEIEF